MTGETSPGTAALGGSLLRAPKLGRRLAALVYEGVLLVGVTLAAGLVYGGLTQQRHALQGKAGLQVLLFVVLALYFTWFWSSGGQTVAMKAWHIRVVRADGSPLLWVRALARYLLAWLWLLPALAATHFAGLRSGGAVVGMLVVGVLAYAALAWLRPDRQFWHDAVCGTRLIDWRPLPRAAAQSVG